MPIDIKETSEKDDRTRLETLLPVYRWGRRLLKAESEEQICSVVGDALHEQLGATSLSVMLLDETTSSLQIVASRGLPKQVIDQSQIEPGERISGRVFETKRPLIIHRDEETSEDIESLLSRVELSASLSFPLVSNNDAIGVINLSHHGDQKRFSRSDLELVSILAQLTVTAIENLRLSAQKQESTRIRTLFEQYVSPEIARVLLDQGGATMELGKIQTLTVLFADIRNYTLLVQNLSLPGLREFLDAFFEMFTRVVYENKGTLDKFMGDGALVIFGAPIEHDNPAESAVNTGKQIIHRFRALRKDYLKRNKFFSDISLGIGISSGEMFIGKLGSRDRFDYTVVGPDVNIAQRLASGADGDKVLCTDLVLKACRRITPRLPAESMHLRGFIDPITVHEVELDE
ncbi:MAG: GAF domain-containing protein [Desulfofustis sp.]|nr:GAF domain-containing protein [Desulfofustis sp.]NNK14406.1 GAF domain-containing protein [Desulfofustis sp.]